ncbi:hypothetical protein IAG44_17920 [Streptomyces roseirectus]|uniref:Uncharacterized protein n=1 Tax=Streptomyces roseirectus TaxID=2768066 RepID=A0A7H0IEB6_9ACTN|nr:hypothetical protein [Streptomyces roseirectus]QNP71132.1 hypothetical protein IAG44_17920 [Streptomyces roseirectus]
MDISLPDQLGAAERESCAAVREVTRKLNLSAPPEQITGQQEVAFVPVTRAQWKTVLREANLSGLQRETDEKVTEILRLRTASGRTVGKQLPELLRSLHASVVALSAVAEEVSRFSPSRTSAAERRLATDLARANRNEVQALFVCLEQGWAESAWSAARKYALAAQAAGRTLETAAKTDHADLPDEDVYQRTLGVSAEQVGPGSGVASRARLLAAWAEAPQMLDHRLRRSMRHLIDDSLPLTVILLHHLAVLAISDRPLVTHRAALLGRDLVTSHLKSDPELACSVMARHVAREPEMVSAHRGQIAYLDACYEEEYQEEKARAVMDLHRAVLEADVRRTAVVVLELLGRTVPQGASLATVRDLLAAQDGQPLCKLLASTIRSEWRNANAHEDFHWDPVNDTLLLGGRPADLDEVLDAALRARAICRGFEHGVAVAYAQNTSLVVRGAEDSNYVGRDLSILQAAGEVRFPVLDIRRRGSLVRLDVPDVSVESLREAFRAILRGAIADPSVECWELRQESPDRPLLHVDRTGTHAGLQVAEPLWDTADPLPFATLPLLANAMTNAGEPAEATASTVLCLAAAHVLGERDRLSPALAHGDPAAKDELISTTKLISDGAKAAARLMEGAAHRKLLAFAEVLAGECHRLKSAPPFALVREFVPAYRALRRHGPPHLPWITGLHDSAV